MVAKTTKLETWLLPIILGIGLSALALWAAYVKRGEWSFGLEWMIGLIPIGYEWTKRDLTQRKRKDR